MCRTVADAAILRHYAKDEMIVRQGETGLGMYIISSGRVKVEREEAGTRVQVAALGPGQSFAEMAILDETDSGLDIDSLKAVATGVAQLIGPSLGVLLITHYQRILDYITPDFVHVMVDGRIVKSGGKELAHELEEKGYEGLRKELGLEGNGAASAGR